MDKAISFSCYNISWIHENSINGAFVNLITLFAAIAPKGIISLKSHISWLIIPENPEFWLNWLILECATWITVTNSESSLNWIDEIIFIDPFIEERKYGSYQLPQSQISKMLNRQHPPYFFLWTFSSTALYSCSIRKQVNFL